MFYIGDTLCCGFGHTKQIGFLKELHKETLFSSEMPGCTLMILNLKNRTKEWDWFCVEDLHSIRVVLTERSRKNLL